jgi:hypothetical protein
MDHLRTLTELEGLHGHRRAAEARSPRDGGQRS